MNETETEYRGKENVQEIKEQERIKTHTRQTDHGPKNARE